MLRGQSLEPGGCFVIEVIVPPWQRLPPANTVIPFDVSPAHLGFDEINVATQNSWSHHYWFVDGETKSFGAISQRVAIRVGPDGPPRRHGFARSVGRLEPWLLHGARAVAISRSGRSPSRRLTQNCRQRRERRAGSLPDRDALPDRAEVPAQISATEPAFGDVERQICAVDSKLLVPRTVAGRPSSGPHSTVIAPSTLGYTKRTTAAHHSESSHGSTSGSFWRTVSASSLTTPSPDRHRC